MNISRICIPADVPPALHATFIENMQALSHHTDNLFIFSCDQKIEHLNADFFGESIAPEALYPEHLFNIASYGSIGGIAIPFGFLTRYGFLFPHINYIAKLNGSTHSIPLDQMEPQSAALWSVHDVVKLKQDTNLPIRGVGLTLYLGSEYEDTMLAYAAQTITQAHAHGLIAILWIYARGKAIKDETTPDLIAGMCGLANALGADVVKIKPPIERADISITQQLRIATAAAGNTAVVCAGGIPQEPQIFLQALAVQMREGQTRGCAVGRMIFQKPLPEARAMTDAIAALVYTRANADDALKIYDEKRTSYNLQMHS